MRRDLLVRLYPRLWRHRYGEEFARLLEDTPLSAGVVANVAKAAAKEWLFRTFVGVLVLGPAIAFVALVAARLLSVLIAAEPTFTYEAGQRIVTPPWPTALGVLPSYVAFALLGRVTFGALRGSRIRDAEFAFWICCLFAGSVCQQWSQLIMNIGTGVPLWTGWTTWSFGAVGVTSNLTYLSLLRRIPYEPTVTSPYTGSSRPLGLS